MSELNCRKPSWCQNCSVSGGKQPQLHSQHVANQDPNSGLLFYIHAALYIREEHCLNLLRQKTCTAAADRYIQIGELLWDGWVAGQNQISSLILNTYLTSSFYSICQGLQIFILYTVKTKIFQDEASKMFKSLSSSAERLKPLRPFTELRLRLRMYNMLRSFPTLNERFKVLDPFIVTEETTLSESEETKASI